MYRFESVSALNNFVRDIISNNDHLNSIELTGEISEFKTASSGHCYFRLKDQRSSISCVIFKGSFQSVDFEPKTGDKVVIKGSAELYPPTGSFQVKAYSIVKEGAGDLHERYLKLFEKLKKEGLFDEDHKKKIPVLPIKIGVVTSPTGAVIHDITDTLRRRNPNFHLVLYPASVQGDSCPSSVIEGLKCMQEVIKPDVVIVARGGGSYEDLFGFNDEGIARYIYGMTIPVISAVGHEVDYTICDYVSDLRAPTPTAAAELVLSRYSDLEDYVSNSMLSLDIAMNKYLDIRQQTVNGFANHKALVSPLYYAQNQVQVVKNLEYKLNTLINQRIDSLTGNVKAISDRLESLDPNNVLSRGYSFISDENGRAVESVAKLHQGDNIKIMFSDGYADSTVNSINIDETGRTANE